MIEHHYRGETIQLNQAAPVGRRDRYNWNGRPFAQLRMAKNAIDDHKRSSEPCIPSSYMSPSA